MAGAPVRACAMIFFAHMARKTNPTVYMVVDDKSHGGGQDRARGRPVVDARCLRGEDPFQEAASGRVHKSPSMKESGPQRTSGFEGGPSRGRCGRQAGRGMHAAARSSAARPRPGGERRRQTGVGEPPRRVLGPGGCASIGIGCQRRASARPRSVCRSLPLCHHSPSHLRPRESITSVQCCQRPSPHRC